MNDKLKKIFQKKLYDILSHKYGILTLLAGAFLITVSAFHFGEAWLEWSHEKYEAVFNSFSDNIAGRSFRERLSSPLPIDVVYTWVNGTDPDLIRQLELAKVSLEKQMNMTREETCTFTNCLSVGLLVHPPLLNVLLEDVQKADSSFLNATDLQDIKENKDGPSNFTLITMEQESLVKLALKHFSRGWYFHGTNHTLRPAYYTSEVTLPHGLPVPEIIMMSGYPSHYTDGDVQQVISKRINITDKGSIPVKMYKDKGVSLLQIPIMVHYDKLIKEKNFTIDHKVQRLSPVKLVWDLRYVVKSDVVAANRFEDNEELRYSLRSLEQFAPWVRHIYIVTNGQIPYWLNLDSSRVTIITHEEIFSNLSYLPTFSSPAIEANIHKIPGLSDKFLYLNDDVMFGSPVWPDDFYTHSTGQKLYLTWPVPNCNEGCPSTWIRDGYCDKACNSSECDWDGGDCLSSNGRVQLGAGFHDSGHRLSDFTTYCNTGCANNWLSDKYCDQACNTLQCGFDIGDCGVKDYNKLYNIEFNIEKTHFRMPPGELIGYFNLSNILVGKNKVKSASYSSNTVIRAMAVSNKFKVLTVVLNKDHNATVLQFDLTYQINDNNTKRINFTLHVDTSVTKMTQPSVSSQVNETTVSPVNLDDVLDAEAFTAFTGHQRNPAINEPQASFDLAKLPSIAVVDILDFYKNIEMTKELKTALFQIEKKHKEGELTELGLKIEFYEVLLHHNEELESLRPQFDEERLKYLDEKLKKEELNKISYNDSTMNSLNLMNLPVRSGHGLSNETKQKNRRHLATRSLQQQKHNTTDDMNNWHKFRDGLHRPDNIYEFSMDLNRKDGAEPRAQAGLQADVQTSVRFNSHKVADKLPKLGKYNAKEIYIKVQESRQTPDVAVESDHRKNETNLTGQVTLGNTGRKLLAALYWSDLEEQREKNLLKMREDNFEEEMSDEDFLKLVSLGDSRENVGVFPWEKKDEDIYNEELERRANEYTLEGWQGRQLLDTFGDSLRHVNHIYNKEFGFQARKVPGHMPHMIDKNIMSELQSRFPKEWDATSAHKFRSATDMQYAFSYYYYVMGVSVPTSVEDIFYQMDTDRSGVLSDREIRTLAARMYDLPLYLETLTGLEAIFTNCSQNQTDSNLVSLSEDQIENYYDKSMPQITKYLFLHCEDIEQLIKAKFKAKLKYKYTTADDSEITFKMIHTNVSHVVGQLDEIRKRPKKFICLNDNIDHTKEEAKTVKAILQDFYESLLPIPSQFELARDYRNRFLHMSELKEWRIYRDRLRFWTHVALFVLVFLAVLSFFGDKIEGLKRKWMNGKRRRNKPSESPESLHVTTTSVSKNDSSSIEICDNVLETV